MTNDQLKKRLDDIDLQLFSLEFGMYVILFLLGLFVGTYVANNHPSPSTHSGKEVSK
jgi:hypothetical protein